MYKFIKRIIRLILNYISGLKYLFIKNSEIIVDSEDYRRNIVLISHNSQKAGAPVLLEHIAKELKVKGYNIVIISRQYGDMIYRFKSICHTSVCFSKRSVERKVRKLYLLGYRNVICNTVITGDLVPMLKKCGFKTLSLVHELPNVIEELNAVEKAIDMVKYSDEVVFPSEFVYEKFCSVTKFPFRHMVKTQGLYLNANHKFDRQASLQGIKEKYGYQIKNNVILNVATINKRKGFDIFLEMASKDPGNQYIWVGDTNCRYYRSCLSNYSEGIPKNLFLPGYIDDPNLLACFYDIADIFVLTSREEPFGTIVLEAFNAFTPVIAFEGAGGYTDIVKNDYTGILTEYESVEGMVYAVNNLLNNPQSMKEMMGNCKKVVNNYSFKAYIEFLINIFEKENI